MDDTLCGDVLNYLKNGTYPPTVKGESRDATKLKKRKLRKTAAIYSFKDDDLYHKGVRVARRSQVADILQELHNSPLSGGHLGMNKTYAKVRHPISVIVCL